MTQQEIWKVGKAETERLELTEGQVVAFEPHPIGPQAVMTPRLREIYEQVWAEHADGYRYLADR